MWTSNAPVAFSFQNNDKSGYSKPNMTVMLTWITFCKTRHFALFENYPRDELKNGDVSF